MISISQVAIYRKNEHESELAFKLYIIKQKFLTAKIYLRKCIAVNIK